MVRKYNFQTSFFLHYFSQALHQYPSVLSWYTIIGFQQTRFRYFGNSVPKMSVKKGFTNQFSFVYMDVKSLYILLSCPFIVSCVSYSICCLLNLYYFDLKYNKASSLLLNSNQEYFMLRTSC